MTRWVSADQTADDILRELRRQGALTIACHPHHRTTRRLEISTCYLWEHRQELADLVDVWEAANRDDLFSVTSLKHYPYVANSDFHKPKHLYSWKTLVRSEKTWPAIRAALRGNTDIAITLFRRESWRLGFVTRVKGFARADAIGDVDLQRDDAGNANRIGSAPVAVEKVRRTGPIVADEVLFSRKHSTRVVKATLPAPSYLHYPRGNACFERGAYRDLDARTARARQGS